MRLLVPELLPPTPWLARIAIAMSALGWYWVLLLERGPNLPALCSAAASLAVWRADMFGAWLQANPPSALAAGWLAMLLAMMPPMLRRPAAHVWRQSLHRRRWSSVATFASGYFMVWACAGVGFVAAAVLLLWIVRGETAIAACLASGFALFWQSSPWRQGAFNRCHRHPSIAAFGLRAVRDAWGFGITHALNCVAVCGPWMLVVMMSGPMHWVAMALLWILLVLERDRPARPQRWTWPFALLLARTPQPAHAGLLRPRRGPSRAAAGGRPR
jgi:predicted metal-binding membrane protein